MLLSLVSYDVGNFDTTLVIFDAFGVRKSTQALPTRLCIRSEKQYTSRYYGRRNHCRDRLCLPSCLDQCRPPTISSYRVDVVCQSGNETCYCQCPEDDAERERKSFFCRDKVSECEQPLHLLIVRMSGSGPTLGHELLSPKFS